MSDVKEIERLQFVANHWNNECKKLGNLLTLSRRENRGLMKDQARLRFKLVAKDAYIDQLEAQLREKGLS